MIDEIIVVLTHEQRYLLKLGQCRIICVFVGYLFSLKSLMMVNDFAHKRTPYF